MGPKHGYIWVHLRAGRNCHGPATGLPASQMRGPTEPLFMRYIWSTGVCQWGGEDSEGLYHQSFARHCGVVQSNGHYTYRQFNIQQFYVLPTQCVYVFCVDLRTNSDNFTVQHLTDWCVYCAVRTGYIPTTDINFSLICSIKQTHMAQWTPVNSWASLWIEQILLKSGHWFVKNTREEQQPTAYSHVTMAVHEPAQIAPMLWRGYHHQHSSKQHDGYMEVLQLDGLLRGEGRVFFACDLFPRSVWPLSVHNSRLRQKVDMRSFCCLSVATASAVPDSRQLALRHITTASAVPDSRRLALRHITTATLKMLYCHTSTRSATQSNFYRHPQQSSPNRTHKM
jgi:hypothetical protein